MNRKQEHLRQMSVEDFANIRELIAEHSKGLEGRLERYRRRVRIRRYTVATCIFMGCCISYSSVVAAPKYSNIVSSTRVDSEHVCETIHNVIEKL